MPSVWLSISWWTHRLSWLDPIFSWLDPWLDPNFSWLDPKSPWSKKHLFAVQLTTFRSRTRGSSQPSAAPGAVLRYLPHRHPAVAGEVRVGGTAEFQGTTAPAFPGEKNWGRLGYSNPPKKRCRIQIRNRNIVRIYSSCRIFLEVAILVYLLWIIGLGHFIAMIFRDRNIYIYISRSDGTRFYYLARHATPLGRKFFQWFQCGFEMILGSCVGKIMRLYIYI